MLLRRLAAVVVTTALAYAALAAPDGARAAPPAPGIIQVQCTDSVRDSATLAGAIAASAPGDEIFISGLAGTCKLVEPVTLLGDRSYVGASETGITLLADRARMPYVLASPETAGRVGDPFTLRGLTIDCAGRSAVGLLVRSWHVDVENIAADSCTSAGVDDAIAPPARSTAVNSVFRGLELRRCGHGFESGAGVTDGYLLDSWVVGATHAGIEVEDAAGWEINGNHVYDYSRADPVAGDALDVRRMYATTVADNYVEDFGGRTPADGIRTTAESGWGSVISGNKVFSRRGEKASEFISVWGLSGSSHVVVTGNDLMGTGAGTGLAYHRNGNDLLVTSTGNQVVGVAKPRFASPGTLNGGY